METTAAEVIAQWAHAINLGAQTPYVRSAVLDAYREVIELSRLVSEPAPDAMRAAVDDAKRHLSNGPR